MVFTQQGTYVSEVIFESEEGVRHNRLHLKYISENLKYFVFEGPPPHIVEKKEKETKIGDKKAKKSIIGNALRSKLEGVKD